MSADANQRLADAHRRLAEAKAALNAATVTAEAARKFAAEVGLEVLRHVKRNEDRAAIRAAALMRSLKVVGAKPKLKSEPKLADDHRARLDAENRAALAHQAREELAAEERSAQQAVDDAHVELEAAARSVLAREAEQHAVFIAAIEREALQHRIELEGAVRSGAFGLIKQNGLSEVSRRIVRENEALSISVRNAPEWASANEAAEAWRRRLAILLKNNDAPAETDGRIKESA
jgi:hypothetical protein